MRHSFTILGVQLTVDYVTYSTTITGSITITEDFSLVVNGLNAGMTLENGDQHDKTDIVNYAQVRIKRWSSRAR